MALNLVHFGDVHFPGALRGWRPRDLLGKKLVGLVSVKLTGRGRTFRDANAIVEAMFAEIRSSPPDAILFSGDATMLALPAEFANAAARLHVNDPTLPPGFAVPGNHDYYTRHAGRAGGFERVFAPWQVGERVDGHHYPFARRVGPVWLIGVNSSYPRFGLGSSGTIGAEQLARFRILCARLSPGPRILVTHYPLRDAHGQLERANHRLRDHAAALATAVDCGISLWVHGHIHRPFVLPPGAEIPFPVICAGSATQARRWAYNRYRIDRGQLAMTRRVYDPTARKFRDESTEDMSLRRTGDRDD